MVSGHAPIQAHKIRYYQDPNFKRRVLAPPELTVGSYPDAPRRRANDWSELPVAVRPVLNTETDGVVGGMFADAGGLQLQPSLAHEPLHSAPEPAGDDLVVLDDGDDGARLHDRERVQRRMSRTARLAALDPDDGIAL